MTLPTRPSLDVARQRAESLLRQMIAAQEELDWQCYRLYGLLPPGTDAAAVECAAPPEVALGERAFEIVLARRRATGREQATWFSSFPRAAWDPSGRRAAPYPTDPPKHRRSRSWAAAATECWNRMHRTS